MAPAEFILMLLGTTSVGSGVATLALRPDYAAAVAVLGAAGVISFIVAIKKTRSREGVNNA